MKFNNFRMNVRPLVVCLLLIIILMVLFTGCKNAEDPYVTLPTVDVTEGIPTPSTEINPTEGSDDDVHTTDNGTSDSVEQPTIDLTEDGVFDIHTPYITLQYPMAWQDYCRFDVSDTVVSCVAVFADKPEVKLFDVVFGEEIGTSIGYIDHDGELILVSVLPYKLQTDDSWSQGDLRILRSMMEDMNLVVDQISQIVRDADSEYFYIPAPLGVELRFPAVWRDYVEARVSDADDRILTFVAVINEGQQIPLFDLYFGIETGSCIGYLTQESGMVPIYLVVHDIQVTGDMSDQDISRLYGMQEGFNVIIDGLAETGNFKYPDI